MSFARSESVRWVCYLLLVTSLTFPVLLPAEAATNSEGRDADPVLKPHLQQLASAQNQPGVTRFDKPAWGGGRLDACRRYVESAGGRSGVECGLPAATAYCQAQGFTKATRYGTEEVNKTHLLSGQSCEAGKNFRICGAFTFIECEKGLKFESPPAEPPRRPGQKISDAEMWRIVSWGLMNNRTPEDIQKDINARNRTLGGSGTLPLPLALSRISYKPKEGAGLFSVTVTPEEIEAMRVLDRVTQIRSEMRQLEEQVTPSTMKRIMDILGSDIFRAYAGTIDMVAMARDMLHQTERNGSIDFRYERPPMEINQITRGETARSIEADRKWHASEKGVRATAEKDRIVREFNEAMQNALKTSGVPYDHPSVTVLNRETLRLSGIMQKQDTLIAEMRGIGSRYDIPKLRELEKQVDQRARRGFGRFGEPAE